MTFQKPKRLKRGDKVAIISPSSGMAYTFPWVYEQGLKRIRDEFGLIPIEYPTTLKSSDFLASHPELRAADINNAFADPSIAGIFATTGGNDQIRILPFLNKEIIQSNPKIFLGYSDNTNIHMFLWNCGLISYYGGAVMTQFAMGGEMHGYTKESIHKTLFENSIGDIYAADEWTDIDLDWGDKKNLGIIPPMYKSQGLEWFNAQEDFLKGQLWGGCFEVLELHFLTKQYLPKFENLKNTILFIETSEEMPSEGFVYRFFAALAELGVLSQFKAILVGFPKAQCLNSVALGGREQYILNQKNAVKKVLTDYKIKIPIIFNMNFGHTNPQLIIPNGGEVKINFKLRKIAFD